MKNWIFLLFISLSLVQTPSAFGVKFVRTYGNTTRVIMLSPAKNGTVTFNEAVKYCRELVSTCRAGINGAVCKNEPNEKTYNDWRVPSGDELSAFQYEKDRNGNTLSGSVWITNVARPIPTSSDGGWTRHYYYSISSAGLYRQYEATSKYTAMCVR